MVRKFHPHSKQERFFPNYFGCSCSAAPFVLASFAKKRKKSVRNCEFDWRNNWANRFDKGEGKRNGEILAWFLQQRFCEANDVMGRVRKKRWRCGEEKEESSKCLFDACYFFSFPFPFSQTRNLQFSFLHLSLPQKNGRSKMEKLMRQKTINPDLSHPPLYFLPTQNFNLHPPISKFKIRIRFWPRRRGKEGNIRTKNRKALKKRGLKKKCFGYNRRDAENLISRKKGS